jgi:hypothetical protein
MAPSSLHGWRGRRIISVRKRESQAPKARGWHLLSRMEVDSQRSDSNRQPLVYKTRALPLSYVGARDRPRPRARESVGRGPILYPLDYSRSSPARQGPSRGPACATTFCGDVRPHPGHVIARSIATKQSQRRECEIASLRSQRRNWCGNPTKHGRIPGRGCTTRLWQSRFWTLGGTPQRSLSVSSRTTGTTTVKRV